MKVVDAAARVGTSLSILVPTLQEEEGIVRCLERARLAAPRAEIIVSDGGSLDRTVALASPLAAVLIGPPGRGRQLNAAARAARGDTLLFLHADTMLPCCDIEGEIARCLRDPRVLGGNFRVHFHPCIGAARGLEWAYRVIRRGGFFFGDSAIFVRREAFLARGGFQQNHLMEDVELVRWMRRAGGVAQVPHPVVTSSRRFQGQIARHLLLWTLLHVVYYCGAPDEWFCRLYPSPGAQRRH